MIIRIVLAAALAIVLAGCSDSSEREAATLPAETVPHSGKPQVLAEPCPVTQANGRVPPNEQAGPGSNYLGNGNGSLWTELYPNPVHPRPEDIHEDGSIELKVPWWRGVPGRLTIEGRRLDATAPPVSAWIPGGYGRKGFQSTAITYPTAGCWQVTGSVGKASLTYVTLIELDEDA